MSRTTEPTVSALRAKMPANRATRSTAAGIGLFLVAAALLAAAYWFALAAPNWPLRIFGGVGIGLVTALLATIGHDCSHGSLTPNATVNKLVGRLSMTIAGHPFSSYQLYHNARHHGFTQLRGEDPAYPPLSLDEYRALSPLGRFLVRLYRTPLGIAPYYIATIAENLWLPNAAVRGRLSSGPLFEFDRLCVVARYGIDIGVQTWVGLRFAPPLASGRPETVALQVAVGVLLPFLIWMWIAGFTTLQHHTHPDVPWYATREEWSFYRGHILGNVHVHFPRLVESLFGNINEHHAHHLDTKIPMYRVAQSQDALESEIGDTITVQVWTPRSFIDTMRRCKLYDYVAHRWLDFDGRPTTDTPRWLSEVIHKRNDEAHRIAPGRRRFYHGDPWR